MYLSTGGGRAGPAAGLGGQQVVERGEEEIKGETEWKEMEDEGNGRVSGGIGWHGRREMRRELKGLMEGI